MKKELIKNLTQILLIVFSVVLGLFLSERIEERKNENEAKKLLSRVTSEVSENKKLIEYWAPYHGEMASALDKLTTDENFIQSFINNKTILFDKVLTRGTFMKRMPSSDAWDIAKSHPLIVNLDYDQLLILSKIYNQQENTFAPFAELTEIFFSPDFNSKEKAQQNLQKLNSRMKEIAGREMQLIDYYNEGEKILKLQ